VFLLLAENAGGLLETIRSRCETLALTPLTPAECQQWLEEHYPEENPQKLRQIAFDHQGILGQAVAQLKDGGQSDEAVRALSRQLALALEKGEELELFQTAMQLEKLSKEELGAVLDRTVTEVTHLLPKAQEKNRLLRAVELMGKLRGAVELNVNAGQIAGWLCAGSF